MSGASGHCRPDKPLYMPRWLMALLLGVGLAACGDQREARRVDFAERVEVQAAHKAAPHHPGGDSVFFGFDLRSSIHEDARQYQPLMDYLEQATGRHFHLVLSTRDDHLDEKLGSGEIDFAAVGAVVHIKGQEQFGVQPVVRGLNASGDAEYRSVIVVKPDSWLQSIVDLRDKQVAFGHVNSTQGHLIPRIELLDEGIELGDLAGFGYLGSHQACANGVISGRYDACGMQDTMGHALASQGLLRVIHTSSPYPSSGISASPRVSTELVEAVRRALVDFQPEGAHAAQLYNWHKTEMPKGFTPAFSDDYRTFRGWMIRLGLLHGQELEP